MAGLFGDWAVFGCDRGGRGAVLRTEEGQQVLYAGRRQDAGGGVGDADAADLIVAYFAARTVFGNLPGATLANHAVVATAFASFAAEFIYAIILAAARFIIAGTFAPLDACTDLAFGGTMIETFRLAADICTNRLPRGTFTFFGVAVARETELALLDIVEIPCAIFFTRHYAAFVRGTFDIFRGAFGLLARRAFVVAAIGAFYFLTTRLGADHQTNTIYFCFLTLPWLVYHAKSRNEILLLLIFTFLALLSFKRSVMLASVLMWLFFILQRLESRRNMIYTTILLSALFIGISVMYARLDSQFGGVLSERVNREETDEGHDRMAIWNLTIIMIQNSPAERLVAGHGHFGVRKNSLLEISAHNDFLEVIYDYGLVIFFLYLCLWWHVLRRCYQLYKRQSSLFLPYGVTLSIFIVMSMVSHLVLYANYFNYLVMFWGMTEAMIETQTPGFKRKAIKR